MKKIFKTLLVAIVIFVASNLFTATGSELKANTRTEKQDLITIVRSVENGVHYITVFVGDVMVCKDIEL